MRPPSARAWRSDAGRVSVSIVLIAAALAAFTTSVVTVAAGIGQSPGRGVSGPLSKESGTAWPPNPAATVPKTFTNPTSSSSGELSVIDTLVLSNNTLIPGNFRAPPNYSIMPVAAVYDSAKGEVFVADYGSNHVSVISDRNDSVVGTVEVSTPSPLPTPFAMTYDRARGEVFVGQYSNYFVSVISDHNDSVVANVRVGISPVGLAYDAAKGEVFVASQATDNVSVINDTTNAVVATVGVGSDPNAAAYDGGNGLVYVTNGGQGTVSIISYVYSVTFTESGLPPGTNWSVTTNGVRESNTTSSIRFEIPHGTYNYTIGSVSDYRVSPGKGTLTVPTMLLVAVTYSQEVSPPPIPLWLGVVVGGMVAGILVGVVFFSLMRRKGGGRVGDSQRVAPVPEPPTRSGPPAPPPTR